MSSLRDFLTKVFVLFHQNVIPTGLANDAICHAYGTTTMASQRDYVQSHRIIFFYESQRDEIGVRFGEQNQ